MLNEVSQHMEILEIIDFIKFSIHSLFHITSDWSIRCKCTLLKILIRMKITFANKGLAMSILPGNSVDQLLS